MTTVPRLTTDRLTLLALSADALDAFIAGDRKWLKVLTGASFPDPVVAPPLMDDALPFMRDQVRSNPADVGWWPWLIVVTSTGEAAGSLGLAGRPDDDGRVTLGYALYPAYEGHGYATEAARALVGWALGQPGVRAVRATIPVGHTPSLRVAERLGMGRVGTSHDADVGEVGIFEVRGEQQEPADPAEPAAPGADVATSPDAGLTTDSDRRGVDTAATDPPRHPDGTVTAAAPSPEHAAPQGGGTMATFILLSTLTDDGAQTIQHNPERILRVNDELARMGVTVVSQWAVLGAYDFVSVVEAKDTLTIARVSAVLASRGSSRFLTLPAIPINEFIAGMQEMDTDD